MKVPPRDLVSEGLARPRVADVSGWPWPNGAWSPPLAFMRAIPARHQAKSCHSMNSTVAGTILQMREWRLRGDKGHTASTEQGLKLSLASPKPYTLSI